MQTTTWQRLCHRSFPFHGGRENTRAESQSERRPGSGVSEHFHLHDNRNVEADWHEPRYEMLVHADTKPPLAVWRRQISNAHLGGSCKLKRDRANSNEYIRHAIQEIANGGLKKGWG